MLISNVSGIHTNRKHQFEKQEKSRQNNFSFTKINAFPCVIFEKRRKRY